MKKSKLLALFLALTLLLVFAMPAFAEETAGKTDGTITISPPASHALTASDFTQYKLFDLVRITGTAPNYRFVYKPTAAVQSFLNSLGTAALGGYGVTTSPSVSMEAAAEEFRIWLQKNFSETYDEAAIIALAKAMITSSGVPSFASFGAKTAAKVGSDVVFSGLSYGYYLITGSGLRSDNGEAHSANVISRGMLVNVPELTRNASNAVTGWTKDARRNLKANAPGIDKNLKKDDGTWGKETDRNIGDTVEYEVLSKVPDTTGYTWYTFTVRDTLSPGLTFKTAGASFSASADIKITVGGASYTDYTATLVTQANGSTLLTIVFNYQTFPSLPIGADIRITYAATLNEKAVVGVPGNPNKVQLEYARNPNVTGACETGFTPEVETVVYTFDINVEKVDENDKAVKLAGAEFLLKATDSATAPGLWFKKNGNVYTLATPQNNTNGATQTLVSDNAGVIVINGLDAGTYYLEETKAPVGYNPLDARIPVAIAHLGKGDYTIKVGSGAAANGKTAKVVVENNTGGILPGTGGMGTTIFFAVGGIMALLLAAAFIVYKRKKALLSLLA